MFIMERRGELQGSDFDRHYSKLGSRGHLLLSKLAGQGIAGRAFMEAIINDVVDLPLVLAFNHPTDKVRELTRACTGFLQSKNNNYPEFQAVAVEFSLQRFKLHPSVCLFVRSEDYHFVCLPDSAENFLPPLVDDEYGLIYAYKPYSVDKWFFFANEKKIYEMKFQGDVTGKEFDREWKKIGAEMAKLFPHDEICCLQRYIDNMYESLGHRKLNWVVVDAKSQGSLIKLGKDSVKLHGDVIYWISPPRKRRDPLE